MNLPEEKFADVEGHDTTAQEIVRGFQGLHKLDRTERYELLADLYRDGAGSDAAYVLLSELAKLLHSLDGEVGLDVTYIVGSIQIECLKFEASKYRDIAIKVCRKKDLVRTAEFISQWEHHCRSDDDLNEAKKLQRELLELSL